MDQPTADNKNWTWVLERACGDCGYDGPAVDRSTLGAKIRANAAQWRRLLGSGADRVTQRPPDGPDGPVWSALEYGCHVRDVYELFRQRLELILKEDNPHFANWSQDETAIAKNYPADDPERVAYDLAVNAGKIADVFDDLSDAEWMRTGNRSDGSTFTAESLGLYLLHDPVHHLWDVAEGFAALDAD